MIPLKQKDLFLPFEIGVCESDKHVYTDEFEPGRTHSTSVIESLTSLNGMSIVEMEKNLKPDNVGFHGTTSLAGFLGESASLIETLATDNKTVLGAGLTHQYLATPLQYVVNIYNRNRTFFDKGGQFEFNGQTYEIKGQTWKSYQFSPFRKEEATNQDFTVINIETNEEFKFSGLLPSLISEYGFYEGPSCKYRVAPENIVSFFNLK